MSDMRSHLLIPLAALLMGGGMPSSFAQQGSPDAGFVAPRPAKPRMETIPVEKAAPYDINGVVAQAFRMKKPLELINPLAPPRYDKDEDITWDPDNPEKPKGIVLLGIQW